MKHLDYSIWGYKEGDNKTTVTFVIELISYGRTLYHESRSLVRCLYVRYVHSESNNAMAKGSRLFERCLLWATDVNAMFYYDHWDMTHNN